MTDLLVYVGIALIVTGCIIYIYGALWYWRAQKTAPALSSYRDTLRVKFYRYRLTWWILSVLGAVLTLIAALV